MRGDWFDSTSALWVNPSPNLRDLNQATLYPGVALIEQTNVSVGRGTDTPFEVVGAPWVSAKRLAAYLNEREHRRSAVYADYLYASNWTICSPRM